MRRGALRSVVAVLVVVVGVSKCFGVVDLGKCSKNLGPKGRDSLLSIYPMSSHKEHGADNTWAMKRTPQTAPNPPPPKSNQKRNWWRFHAIPSPSPLDHHRKSSIRRSESDAVRSSAPLLSLQCFGGRWEPLWQASDGIDLTPHSTYRHTQHIRTYAHTTDMHINTYTHTHI